MNDGWTLGEKAITSLVEQLDAERALADDLAAVLTDLGLTVVEERPVDWEPFERVMARWREARQQ